MAGKDFQPVNGQDVTDLALLPRRFDAFVSEMRDAIRTLSDRFSPVLKRLEDMLDDINHDVGLLKRDMTDVQKRVAALEAKKARARAARKK